jgi:peptidoglycan/LPS O-acetylase OafA/YrhL
MPGIDALRAIAVLAVFAYHVGADWMPGGFLGVDVFFVISGYLITALLLDEYRGTGHLNVLQFWLRRARRLLPAVGVMIAVTLLVAAIFIPEDLDKLRGDAVASLLYVNNWHLIFTDQSYFEQFARPSLFLHLWSLSVEEQFYLFWPLTFAAGMTLFGRRRLLYGVIAGALLSTLLMIILFKPGSDPLHVFYGTDTRAVGLLGGVALALVWHPNDLRVGAGRGAAWVLDAIGIFALVMILRDFIRVHDFDPSVYRGGFLLLAIWTTLLVGVLAHPAAHLGRVLGNPPLVWLGLRSYSFYLWHWPILVLTRPDIDVSMNHTVLALLQLGATLLLADLSYRYVEQPFRQRVGVPTAPEWLRMGRVALAAGIVLTVLVVGWSGLFSSGGGPSPTEVAQAKEGPIAQAKVTGKPPSVLALGDSVMVGAADGLERRLGGDAVVDAAIGRQAGDYPGVIDNYRKLGILPDEVVVQMGNNGPVYASDIDDLENALRGVDGVYLLNVRVPRSWEGEVNDELSQAVDDWPNAKLLDWYDIASSNGELTYDGIHLTPDGDRAYSDLIAKAVGGENGQPG